MKSDPLTRAAKRELEEAQRDPDPKLYMPFPAGAPEGIVAFFIAEGRWEPTHEERS